MSKFTVAAMLTLPLLALGQQRAAADGWGLFSWAHKGNAGCATCNQGAANPGYPANYAGYPQPIPVAPPAASRAAALAAARAAAGPLGCGLGCTPFGCFPVTLGIKGFLNSPPPWAACIAAAGKNDCCGKVPGPWYLYWPDPRGVGMQTGPGLSWLDLRKQLHRLGHGLQRGRHLSSVPELLVRSISCLVINRNLT